MTRTISWIPAALLGVLAAAGVWLIAAPFTVGNQPHGAAWTLATRNDLIGGAVLLAVSLLTLACILATFVYARARRASTVTAPGAGESSGSATGVAVTGEDASGGGVGVADAHVSGTGIDVRGRLTGTVRSSASGCPIGEALVTLIDTDGAVVGAVSTGPDGEYTFDDIPEGSYTLTAAGYAPTATGIQLAPGMSGATDIALNPPQAST